MPDADVQADVVDILATDHTEATDLLAQVRATTDPARRRELLDTAVSELVRHAVAEEMYVYPAMRKHLADGERAVEHDIAEHKELEATMKEFEAVDADSPEFDDALDRLDALLADHIRDEEAEQFPQLRARLPREELVELGEKVQNAKKLAPTRPHPNAPNSELFHKLVGPGVGLVDRLRDKLSGRTTA
ncbi:hemerythrin domain-containing protein [Dactylosporangium vinaceum]|uniref:Hemerythrin domain-containing protein n=1 Tax=Dactylosporangium vinaceum TaxID=53362 RepID=A0ABV5LXZ6_9ACTN|nr:hemerythrin domain-containing protein [Dactylosporangium vinaceum]UAC00980.1 hemerythrin domain-containing protein [Dactylosporangium vinaceum]